MHYVYPEVESKEDTKKKILKFKLTEKYQEVLVNILRLNQNSSQDCRIMMDYIFNNKLKKILELGVSQGYSTVPLLMVSKKLISVDNVNCYDNVMGLLKRWEIPELSLKWRFILMDDLELLFDRFDMIFLDTSHDYNHTIKELNKFSNFSDNIFCHDYNQNGVRWAVQDFLKDNDWQSTQFDTSCGLILINRRS